MKFKLTIIILFLKVIDSFAQCTDCAVKAISTDPRSSTNCEKPTVTNQFYWFPNNGNNNSQFSAFYSYAGGNITGSLNNPYWATSSGPIVGALAGSQYSDFYPEDGWEVIKIDNGYLANNSTPRNTAKSMIYMCFYNKYRGVMRFFGMLPSGPPWQVIRYKITMPQFKKSYGSTNYNYQNQPLGASNTLSIQGSSMQPLDQQTEETVLEVLTQFPGGSPSEHFFWFEVPIAYDPCICKNDVAIYLEAAIEQTFDLKIKGAIGGEILQKTVVDKDALLRDYDKLVINRIIGAASATATAIATEGSVIQVSKFTDLIDVFSQKPGLSAESQNKLSSLKSILNTSADFVYDEKTNKWRNSTTSEEITKEEWEKIFTSVNTYLTGAYDIYNPSGGGSKTTTSIVASLTATGTASTFVAQGSSIYWGMPGSKMSKNLNETETAVDANNNGIADYIDPEYPLHNQILGTFALLRTPTVQHKLEILELCDEPDLINGNPSGIKSNNPKHTIRLKDDFLYYINPNINTNFSKLVIKTAFVLKTTASQLYDKDKIRISSTNSDLTTCGDNLEDVFESLKTKNFSKTMFGDEYMTPLLHIDQFRELISTFTFDKDFIVNVTAPDKIFIRFYIEMESNNLGKDGKPVRTTQIFTLPVKIENYTGNFPEIIEISDDGNEMDFNADVAFSDSKSLHFKGLVKISAKLSTTIGTKKKIYSLVGFEIEPGGEVSSDIELILGYPFLGTYPQPMQTATFVENFCTNQINGLQYKAGAFSSLVPIDNHNVNTTDQQNIDFYSSIYPNPNNGNFTINVHQDIPSAWSVMISDLAGKVMYRNIYPVGNNRTQINIDDFDNGVYLVQFESNGKKKTERTVVIK